MMSTPTFSGVESGAEPPRVITTVSNEQNCNLLMLMYEINPPADEGNNRIAPTRVTASGFRIQSIVWVDFRFA